MERVNITCRLPIEDVAFLDRIAESQERDRSYLIRKAVDEFIAVQRWQLEEVDKALSEADAGHFATVHDVKAAFDELRSCN